jgi:hypothetical protein
MENTQQKAFLDAFEEATLLLKSMGAQSNLETIREPGARLSVSTGDDHVLHFAVFIKFAHGMLRLIKLGGVLWVIDRLERAEALAGISKGEPV